MNRVIEDIQEDEIEVDDFRTISCWADDPMPMDESSYEESSYGPGDKIDESGNRLDSPFPSDQSESSSQLSSSIDSQSSQANSFSQSEASFSSQTSTSTQKSTARKRNRRTKSLKMGPISQNGSENGMPTGQSYSDLAKTKSKIEIAAEKAAKEAQIRAEKERQRLENQEERLIITRNGSKWVKSPKN